MSHFEELMVLPSGELNPFVPMVRLGEFWRLLEPWLEAFKGSILMVEGEEIRTQPWKVAEEVGIQYG